MKETEPEQINNEDLPINNDINIIKENKRKIEQNPKLSIKKYNEKMEEIRLSKELLLSSKKRGENRVKKRKRPNGCY